MIQDADPETLSFQDRHEALYMDGYASEWRRHGGEQQDVEIT
jgi:hypothetical protein